MVVCRWKEAGYSSCKVPFALKSNRLVLRPTPFNRLNRRNTESRMPLLLFALWTGCAEIDARDVVPFKLPAKSRPVCVLSRVTGRE